MLDLAHHNIHTDSHTHSTLPSLTVIIPGQAAFAGGAVTNGSLFAALQSAAMTGGGTAIGTTTSVAIGGLLGTSLGAQGVRDFCKFVDAAAGADESSVFGEQMRASACALRGGIEQRSTEDVERG